jgi:glycosyltransferase involved in cell wall biosynthesis
MRLLFLTCHLPYPPHSGGRLREHELLARLTQRFDVHVAAVTKTLAEDAEAVAQIPWDHHGVSLFAAAPLSQLEGLAPQVARHRSKAAAAGIGELLAAGGFDAVHVEGFYLWQHLSRARPPAVLVEQNIEWQLFEQQGRDAQAGATRRAELAVWRQADVLGALTRADREVIARHTGRAVHLVPDGADHLHPPPRAPRRAASGERILMVANFGYAPNVDGAAWFVREVMPRIRVAKPAARLQLVGASPPPEIRALACDDVDVTGRVPDVAPYLHAADVVVCPLRYGGGVKVKMLEALRAGKAIVSTDVGCQGLSLPRGAVDRASAGDCFARAVIALLTDPERRAHAERAAAAVELPTWDDAAEALAECWRLATRRSRAAA